MVPSLGQENDNSRVNLLDPPDVIRAKVKRCKTDALPGLEWARGPPSRPGYPPPLGEGGVQISDSDTAACWGAR